MHGQSIRLRGMSFFWSQWESEFYNANVVQWLAADWNVQLLRLPMAVESEDGGYLDFPDRERGRVETVVDAAIELGIYVIIDWHDHRAQDHIEQAKGFFGAMAEKYGQHPNVLFEPYNEPGDTGLEFWVNTVKPYHEIIVSEIRQHSNNIIVLGTPTWSQGMDIASQDPVVGTNLAYTLHFYAGDERHAAIRARAQTALDNGLALVATEWGTCHWNAAQVPALGLDEAQTWLDFLAENKISDANWAISDKEESCSILKPAACPQGRWNSNVLTEAGAWIRDSIRADSPPWFQGVVTGPSECAAALGQCGGRSHCGPTCCVAGYECIAQNVWWSDCQPVEAGGRRLVLV
jgi:endoglucanase